MVRMPPTSADIVSVKQHHQNGEFLVTKTMTGFSCLATEKPSSIRGPNHQAANCSPSRMIIFELQTNVEPDTVNKGFVRNRGRLRSNVLNIGRDIHPLGNLNVVEQFHTGAIFWTKDRLRQRTEFIAGSDVIPAQSEGVAAMFTNNGAEATDTGA